MSISACNQTQRHNLIVIDSNPINASLQQQEIFMQAKAQQPWLQEHYQAFKGLNGHKTLAVSIKDKQLINIGISYDHKSSFLADNRALRQCYFNSAGQGKCVVIERHEGIDTHGLSDIQIESAPPELTTYRNIANYQYYLQAKPPKAFAISSCSLKSFWKSRQNNLRIAKQEVMSACQSNHTVQLPCCAVVAIQE